MSDTSAPDWTAGPAKWAAVVVLGAASLTGIVWSIARGSHPAAPTIVVAREPETPAVTGTGTDNARPRGVQEPKTPALRAARLDLNTATQPELETLPGVGPELAKRIIEYRQTRGPFKGVEQLDGVKGIGSKLMEKIRPMVTVSAAGTR